MTENSSSPSKDPLHGLNPQSLMEAAAMPTDADAETIRLEPRDLPTLEAISAAFPDLEVLELIGHGGMSAVFRARQPKLDRVVALKVLPKSLAATPGFAERFNREGRVLARLNHPNIVTVHDFGESGGFCFLIMEHVDGVNLRQAMRAGRFTPEQALKIIPSICDALQFAHSQGVLHRDIKPENILLDASGKVKIADFGIAKILDEKGGDSMLLTQSGAKLGTAPYMAPEQIEKPSSVDHRADIYSLGVVFYEMLTGELPLGRFAAPSEFAAVSGCIDEIVFRALEKERTRRQQSADEFKTQVEGAGSATPLPKRRRFDLNEPFEYKSKRMLCGLPLLHVVSGSDPATGKAREAHGFFAFGGKARGVFAVGGMARGWFAFGGFAYGLVAIGGLGIGLISVAGLALGLLFACGGLSIGALSIGGLALGWHACGGVAIGWHAIGGQVFAHQGFGGRVYAEEVVKDITRMHPLTTWLGSLMPWMSLLWLPYFPIYAFFYLVFWWAQRAAMVEAGELPREAASKRIFWLVPAVTAACAVAWFASNGMWMLLTEKPPHMVSPTICFIALIVTCTGLLIFIAAIPLWLRLVPRNRFYGFRLPSTMISDERWYEANAFAGRKLFEGSIGVIIAGTAGFHQLPRHQTSYPWAVTAFTLFTLAIVVVSSLWWLRHHPADGPAKKESKSAKFFGQAAIACMVAFFIKGFIFEPYRIPVDSEPGVAKGSHWIASKINDGFSTGNLVVYDNDNGRNWVARVVERQPSGLLLKRATTPDAFFVPWDRIIGKMLFAHFSPDALKQAGAPSNTTLNKSPVTEGTTKAPYQKPALRFLRMKRNNAEWLPALYTPDGKAVTDEATTRLVTSLVHSGISTDNPEVCWLQLWFEHPDFDRLGNIRVDITDPSGNPLPDYDGSFAAPGWAPGVPPPPYCDYVLSPGFIGKLPSVVNLTLYYAIGNWTLGSTLKPNYRGSIAFGTGCLLAGLGDDSDGRAFISWSKEKDDEVQYDAIALLTNGQRVGFTGRSASGSGRTLIEKIVFPEPMNRIVSFQMRSRRLKTAVFTNVVIPPLP